MIRSWLTCLIACLAVATPSQALLVSPLDLVAQADEAQSICTGRVDGVARVSTGGSDAVEAELDFRVERVIRGAVRPGSTIRIVVDPHSVYVPGYSGIVVNARENLEGYQLVLLRQKGDGRYVFARNAWSTLLVAEEAHTAPTLSQSEDERLRWEILNSLQDQDPSVIVSALTQSQILQESELAKVLTPLCHHHDQKVCAAAAIALAKRGIARPALEYLKEHASDSAPGMPPAAFVVLLNVLASKEDLPLIVSLLDSRNARIREISSYLLRRAASDSTAPHLFKALDDKSAVVRYNAVMGLADLTHDAQHAPAYGVFLRNEKEFVDYWKSRRVTDPGR